MTDTPPPPPPSMPPPSGGGGYGGGVNPTLPNPLVSYWKKVVLENYANFEGRARRAELWWYVLAGVCISIVFNILMAIASFFFIFSLIYGLAVLIPGLAVGCRRLHDLGKSGWWLLIGLIPLVGYIILIIWACRDSQPGVNAYGPNPKEAA
jgi:uncharacterized membrane protein YhaH (DUF805 family)